MDTKEHYFIKQTTRYIKQKFSNENTGHDWWHVAAVLRNALAIWNKEGGDRFVITMAALLHELDDIKLTRQQSDQPIRAADWLARLGVDKQNKKFILEIVKKMSFRQSFKSKLKKSLEQQIVEDADRLEALGAIGIARAFAFGGKLGRPLYNPMLRRNKNTTYQQYIKRRGDTIGHFYDKILRLKNKMNTKTGKQLATKRHQFVKAYLAEFYKEWEGKS
jgi:uncharacterized protein